MILIALGANLPSPAGPPATTLRAALARLEQQGVKIQSVSSFYETPAWPDPGQPAYVNAVAAVETTLQPVELLTVLHGVETDFGRLRSAPNASRALDLDLLDHGGKVMTGGVTLPHPRMTERSFVLVPLAEIAPDFIFPDQQKKVSELLSSLTSDEILQKM